MEMIETRDGKTYKLISLRPEAAKTGQGGAVADTTKRLRLYEGDQVVPGIVFADNEHLVVEWIEGTPLTSIEMNKEEYAKLGRFTPCGFRDLQGGDSSLPAEKFSSNLKVMEDGGLLSNETVTRLRNLLRDVDQSAPVSASTAVCFGDTVDKNFIRTQQQRLYYIDVQGIYRKPVGVVATKQLSMIAPSARRSFFEAYNESFASVCGDQAYSLDRDLLFYFAGFVASKLCQSKRTRRLSHIKRGKVAASILEEFSKLPANKEVLVSWILDECEAVY